MLLLLLTYNGRSSKSLNIECELILVSGVSVENILSLTISTQRSTFITWDKSNGKPFHNLITWSDTRANELVERWNKSLTAKVSTFM